MRTVKWNPFLSGVCALLGGACMWAGTAVADVSSTNPAGIIMYPKLLVDGNATYTSQDTLIQLTNTADEPVNLRCFYTNSTGYCITTDLADPIKACNPFDPYQFQGRECESFHAPCLSKWQETDFKMRLTSRQPIAWKLSQGLAQLPLSPDNPFGLVGPKGEFNDNSSIPPAPQKPFLGMLTCVEVDQDERPVGRNDLKGEATIQTLTVKDVVDIRNYNALGIHAIEGANDGDDVLLLGLEYNNCPNVVILDHFFDDAQFDENTTVRTHITLIPCTQDFLTQSASIPGAVPPTVVQYLVFNEFEQRFSTSRSMNCQQEIGLSDIDTRIGRFGDAQSIFNFAVQGTYTGQTLLRGVENPDNGDFIGNGILVLPEEFLGRQPGTSPGVRVRSDAFATQQRGTRTDLNVILMPPAGAAEP
jgi:hypothetical protein